MKNGSKNRKTINVILIIVICVLVLIGISLGVYKVFNGKNSTNESLISTSVSCEELQFAYDSIHDNSDEDGYMSVECNDDLEQKIKLSSANQSYQTVSAGLRYIEHGTPTFGAAGLFYKINNGPWKFGYGTQDIDYCTSARYESEDIRIAFADDTCAIDDYQTTTVKEYFGL